MFDLKHLESFRESNRLEAKKALGGLPKSIWETYSAFANAFGGIILLGVEEYSDRSLHAVDLSDPERMIEEFLRMVNDPHIASKNILSDDDIRIECIEGKRIIVIAVPSAQRRDRPVYVGGDLYHGSYYREGDGDYRLTRDEVDVMLRGAEET